MILLSDVAGYAVGTEEFPKGMTAKIPHFGVIADQAYNVAYARSVETGLPIVAVGPDSQWDPKEKAWVRQ